MKKIWIVLIIVLIAAGFFILNSNNLDLKDKEGRVEFAKTYFGWIGSIAKNTASTIGYAVKLEWLPKQ